MADRWLNLGAPFFTIDGERVARRETFVPTHEEDVTRRKYKLRRVVESGRTQYQPGQNRQEQKEDEDPLSDFALGGGWYQIGGEKVQGRQKATEALQALEG